MTQMPPSNPMSPQAYPPPQRSNGLALASLISGLALCIPYLAGLVAIVLGFLGMKKASDPSVGGKGMAIGGIALGAVNLIGWTLFFFLFGGLMFWGLQIKKDAVAVVDDVFKQVDQGNYQSAYAKVTKELGPGSLEQIGPVFKAGGGYRSVDFPGFNASTVNGVSRIDLTGTLTLANETRPMEAVLFKEGDVWKLAGFDIKAR